MTYEARNHVLSLSSKQIETSRITGDTREPLTLLHTSRTGTDQLTTSRVTFAVALFSKSPTSFFPSLFLARSFYLSSLLSAFRLCSPSCRRLSIFRPRIFRSLSSTFSLKPPSRSCASPSPHFSSPIFGVGPFRTPQMSCAPIDSISDAQLGLCKRPRVLDHSKRDIMSTQKKNLVSLNLFLHKIIYTHTYILTIYIYIVLKISTNNKKKE